MQGIHDKWLTTSSCSQDNTEIESSQLHLRSFLGLFLLCGVACIIALCIYFVWICHRFHHASKTEAVSELHSSRSNLQRLRTLITLLDEKENPSNEKKDGKERIRHLMMRNLELEEVARGSNLYFLGTAILSQICNTLDSHTLREVYSLSLVHEEYIFSYWT
ncbi:Glutamate receptor 3.3 [Bienertia sinuspersici]